MTLTVKEITDGLQRSSIHGRALGSLVPAWERQIGVELEALQAKEIVYAQAGWTGSQQPASCELVVITDSLIVVVDVPNSRDADHTVSIFPRRRLLEIRTISEGDGGTRPEHYRLELALEGRSEPIVLPPATDSRFTSEFEIASVLTALARSL